MEEDKIKVVIIGAGVIGISSAVLILNNELSDVTDQMSNCSLVNDNISYDLIAECFSPNTTSDQAAGLCYAYAIGDTDPKLIGNWLSRTIHRFIELFSSTIAKEAGISVTSGYDMFLDKCTKAINKELLDPLISYRIIDGNSFPIKGSNYQSAVEYTSMMAECKKYIPWMVETYLKGKINIIKRKVTNMEELYKEYDIIINCTGIGANALNKDEDLRPGRGQIIKVEAPWIKHSYLDLDTYVIPCIDYVTVGGTYQVGNWSLDVDETDTDDIWKRSCRLVPSLQKAKIIGHGVGLRPVRTKVRLESEIIQLENNRTVTVIHNYGHGGAGITLSWGCAQDVNTLYHQALANHLLLPSSQPQVINNTRHQPPLKSVTFKGPTEIVELSRLFGNRILQNG